MSAALEADEVLCPSAPATSADVAVLGVVERAGDQARIAYLRPGERVEPAELLREHDLRDLMEAVRFSGRCASARCAQFAEGRCDLARRIVEGMPGVVEAAPNCNIRHACRWFAEHGLAACRRCPAITTIVSGDDPLLYDVASVPASSSVVADRGAA